MSVIIIIIRNNVTGSIEVGIQGNSRHLHLNNGGFRLNRGQKVTVDEPDNWAERFWPKTWCDGFCQTRDCGNKVKCTGAGGIPYGNQDFYHVFNVLAEISPIDGQGYCKIVSYNNNLNRGGSEDLKKWVETEMQMMSLFGSLRV